MKAWRVDPTRTEWWRPAGAGEAAASGSGRPASVLAFRAVMVFILVSVLAPQEFFPALAPLRPALVAALGALAALLFDRFADGRPAMRFDGDLRVAGWLIAWATVTVPLAYWPGGSLAFLLGTYAKTVAAFVLLSVAVDTPARLRLVAWALSLASIPLAVTGVRNFLSGTVVTAGMHGEVKRIIGYDAPLTGNPNDLALLLNLILPLTVALLLLSRAVGARAALLGIAVLEVLGVIVTFSRAGFLTLSVTLSVYLWKLLRRPGRGWAIGTLALILACLPLLPSGYGDRLATIADIDSDPTGSAQARWSDTVSALRFTVAHPIIGAGIGMGALALNRERGPQWTAVHNVYLQFAVELGVPGLVLFLLLFARCVRNSVVVQRRAADSAHRELFHLAEGIQVSLLAFAVGGLFQPVGYNFYFYYVAALAVGAKTASRTADVIVAGEPTPPLVAEGALDSRAWNAAG